MDKPITIKNLALAVSLALFAVPQASFAAQDENAQWRNETTSDGTSVSPRHETGSVVVGGNLYVLGGRRTPPVEVYRPSTDGWENLGAAPAELHHFQPVAVGSKIYVIGAMTCCFPNEPSVAEIHVFNTANSNWSIEGQMPANRLRGGGGTVVYQNKIYMIGGNTQGHSGGAVSWFDEYNPANGTWRTLPDAPTARDHFHAVIIGNELVVTGGRQTDFPNPFSNTVAETNIYNFSTGQWRVGASIPTQRAGSPTVGVGNEVIVLGGEASGQTTAFDTVEAYDVDLDAWRTLQPMIEGRHSGASGILGNRLHMIAGSAGIGGAPETTSHESLLLQDVMVTPEVEEPTEEPTEEPAEEPTEEPTEETTEEPTEETTVEEVVDESATDESENEESDQPVASEPTSEPTSEMENEPTDGATVAEEEQDLAAEQSNEFSGDADADAGVAVVVDNTDSQTTEEDVTASLQALDVTVETDSDSNVADVTQDSLNTSSDDGGGFFGAASWPIFVLLGALVAWRRRRFFH